MNAGEHERVRGGNLIEEVRNNLAVLDPSGVKGIREQVGYVLTRTCVFKGHFRYVGGVVEGNENLLVVIELICMLIIIVLCEQVHVTVVVILGRTHVNLFPFIISLKAPYLNTPVIAQLFFQAIGNFALYTH